MKCWPNWIIFWKSRTDSFNSEDVCPWQILHSAHSDSNVYWVWKHRFTDIV